MDINLLFQDVCYFGVENKISQLVLHVLPHAQPVKGIINFSASGGIFWLIRYIPPLPIAWLLKSPEHQQALYYLMSLCRIWQYILFLQSEFHLLVLNQIQEMFSSVNTSFITFNISYDVHLTHDPILTDKPASYRQSYFKTFLFQGLNMHAENTAVLINLILY